MLPHVPARQVGVVPAMVGVPEQGLPQAPQLLTSVWVFTQALEHSWVAEPLLAPHVPLGNPVTALEQPWQLSVQALPQHTLSTQ
jgi:hypothetical protein